MSHQPNNIFAGTKGQTFKGYATSRFKKVEAHRDRLLAVKCGELPWPEVDAWRQDLHRDFERALSETKLPERPDYEAANRFLIKARRETASQISAS